jgi:glutamate dehydrogenase/leucine dehydrogenase
MKGCIFFKNSKKEVQKTMMHTMRLIEQYTELFIPNSLVYASDIAAKMLMLQLLHTEYEFYKSGGCSGKRSGIH